MSDKFHINLRQARERKGFSQKEVAEKIGVAKSTYSLYESGNRGPNIRTIRKLAVLLNISCDDLLGITDKPYIAAAHFDGTQYTDAELDELRLYAKFLKLQRKNKKPKNS